jgi:hypothetical protein
VQACPAAIIKEHAGEIKSHLIFGEARERPISLGLVANDNCCFISALKIQIKDFFGLIVDACRLWVIFFHHQRRAFVLVPLILTYSCQKSMLISFKSMFMFFYR